MLRSASYASADAAKLHYTDLAAPGYRRRRKGRAFQYLRPDGKPVRDPATVKRIASLVLPPAWQDVWICRDPRGHIQAVGIDARGRKQYRYHSDWRRVRDETKFGRLADFGRSLPRLRARVSRDLRRPGLPREKVLAAVIRLLETSLIRVGNEEYARENHHYGLTTLRDRHAEVHGSRIQFRFKGKSGKDHLVTLDDARLARIVRRTQELPGQELLQYVDEKGRVRDVTSDDVNAYIDEATGHDFSPKDFRTWWGSVLAISELRDAGAFASKSGANRNMVRAIKAVATRLGNTPSVCRKSYIHPGILESYLDGSLLRATRPPSAPRGLTAPEAGLLHMLRGRASMVGLRNP